ncbi:uncharacterized protein [Antedon mediterranea]|uniref:uncharacterized protein n=1 Tax=Antedon mediterranea TaxID=105859 RepID=UPI003AF49908
MAVSRATMNDPKHDSQMAWQSLESHQTSLPEMVSLSGEQSEVMTSMSCLSKIHTTGSFLPVTETYKHLTSKDLFIHLHIPCGPKNSVYLVDNTCNAGKKHFCQRQFFPDDCGVWDSKREKAVTNYFIVNSNGKLSSVYLKDNLYCIESRIKKVSLWHPLVPQPEKVIKMRRYYTHLKAPDTNYRKRVTTLYENNKLTDVALIEYRGFYSNNRIAHGNSKNVETKQPKSLETVEIETLEHIDQDIGISYVQTEQNGQIVVSKAPKRSYQDVVEHNEIDTLKRSYQDVVEHNEIDTLKRSYQDVVEHNEIDTLKRSYQDVVEHNEIETPTRSYQDMAEQNEIETTTRSYQGLAEQNKIETPTRSYQDVVEQNEIETPTRSYQGLAEQNKIETPTRSYQDVVEQNEIETPTRSYQDVVEQNEIDTPTRSYQDVVEQNEIKTPNRSYQCMAEHIEIETPKRSYQSMAERNDIQTPIQSYQGMAEQNEIATPRNFPQVYNIIKEYNMVRKNKVVPMKVLIMLENEELVQGIIQRKRKHPIVILHSDTQLVNFKQKFSVKTDYGFDIVVVDRPFDIGPSYVTATVYKNYTSVTGEHSLVLGPMFLHWDFDYATFHTLFSHLSGILMEDQEDIQSLDFKIGSNQDPDLTKALTQCFPYSTSVLCNEHIKQNVCKHLIT